MRDSQRSCCSPVPWASRVGPTRLIPIRPTSSGARARASSSCTMKCSAGPGPARRTRAARTRRPTCPRPGGPATAAGTPPLRPGPRSGAGAPCRTPRAGCRAATRGARRGTPPRRGWATGPLRPDGRRAGRVLQAFPPPRAGPVDGPVREPRCSAHGLRAVGRSARASAGRPGAARRPVVSPQGPGGRRSRRRVRRRSLEGDGRPGLDGRRGARGSGRPGDGGRRGRRAPRGGRAPRGAGPVPVQPPGTRRPRPRVGFGSGLGGPVGREAGQWRGHRCRGVGAARCLCSTRRQPT